MCQPWAGVAFGARCPTSAAPELAAAGLAVPGPHAPGTRELWAGRSWTERGPAASQPAQWVLVRAGPCCRARPGKSPGIPEPLAKRVQSSPCAAQPTGTRVVEQPRMGLGPPTPSLPPPTFPPPPPSCVSSGPPHDIPVAPQLPLRLQFSPQRSHCRDRGGGRGRGQGLLGAAGGWRCCHASPPPGSPAPSPGRALKASGRGRAGQGRRGGRGWHPRGGEGGASPTSPTDRHHWSPLAAERGAGAGCCGASAPLILGGWVRARSPTGTHVTSRHPLAGGQHRSSHPAPGPLTPPTRPQARAPSHPQHPLPLGWLRTHRWPLAPSGPRSGSERDQGPAGPGPAGAEHQQAEEPGRAPQPCPGQPPPPPAWLR